MITDVKYRRGRLHFRVGPIDRFNTTGWFSSLYAPTPNKPLIELVGRHKQSKVVVTWEEYLEAISKRIQSVTKAAARSGYDMQYNDAAVVIEAARSINYDNSYLRKLRSRLLDLRLMGGKDFVVREVMNGHFEES